MVPPSRKLTVPVGTPSVELTVAVNVTACPGRTDVGDTVRAVTVGTGAVTSKAVEVTAGTPGLEAVRVKPVPRRLTVRSVNVATPLTVFCVRVPPRVAPVGLLPRASVTGTAPRTG